jgi:hypothetical protein
MKTTNPSQQSNLQPANQSKDQNENGNGNLMERFAYRIRQDEGNFEDPGRPEIQICRECGKEWNKADLNEFWQPTFILFAEDKKEFICPQCRAEKESADLAEIKRAEAKAAKQTAHEDFISAWRDEMYQILNTEEV